jgi:hypothetical protein
MKTERKLSFSLLCALLMGTLLAMAAPSMAQDSRAVARFRAEYNATMTNFERLAAARGDLEMLERTREGREAMSRVTEAQLEKVYVMTGRPDLSAGVLASELMAARGVKDYSKSAGFPIAEPIVSQCNSVDYSPSTRYTQLIAKEVTGSILAAATFVCIESILGVNASLVCVPFAIAASIANGFFDTSTFCAGEVSGNYHDANYARLEHLHGDLSAGTTTILNTINTSTTSIISNDNTNTTTIVSNDNANKTAIINNDNANTATLVALSNANTTKIVNNDNANKDALVAEIRGLACEIIQLLHTPDGQRKSAVQACSAAPGFPYSWNKK